MSKIEKNPIKWDEITREVEDGCMITAFDAQQALIHAPNTAKQQLAKLSIDTLVLIKLQSLAF